MTAGERRRGGLLIGAGAAALALLLWFSGTLRGWEDATWTWRVRLLARPGPHTDQIRLILLDQASLDWGSEVNGWSWPWPREVYAPILDFCRRAGARSVAFDVLFTEPSVYGVEDDMALGEAIRRVGRFAGARFLKVRPGSPDADGVTEPIPEVATAARLLANVSDVPDPDGIFRRAGLLRRWHGELVPSLGVATWLVARDTLGRDTLAVEPGHVRIGPHTVPAAPDGTALLRYRGPASVYRTYSAAAVIQSELRLEAGEQPSIDPAELRDRYVLFGFSAPGLLDLRPTPLSRVSPGVVIHATVLDDLLTDDFLRPAPATAVVAGVFLLALLTGLLLTGGGRQSRQIAVSVVMLALPFALGVAAYGPGWWWPILPHEAGVAMALVGALAWNYATEGRQRRFIKQAFRHYLSPAVIERIVADPDALRLGGERRELTIMFSDLAGFTSLSEGLDPEALTALLNDYLTGMTDIILEEGGTLDKYEGDAILAFWNAPLDQPDHAARACRAAVRCQRWLREHNPEFRERCGRELAMRIGIHTGEVVVGNMGSRQRFDYTVLGDAANLASRLEGANKAFRTGTMISGTTRRLAADAILCRSLGAVRVIGRREPVEVFELAGLAGDPEPETWTVFAEALAAWRAGDVDRAAVLLDSLAARDPAAAACAANLAEGGIGRGEPGVWVLDRK